MIVPLCAVIFPRSGRYVVGRALGLLRLAITAPILAVAAIVGAGSLLPQGPLEAVLVALVGPLVVGGLVLWRFSVDERRAVVGGERIPR